MSPGMHAFRYRAGRRPLHLASCWCWDSAGRPTSFGRTPRPSSSLWAYLASPFRSRGAA